MVEPGASSDEIREEVFESFRRRIGDSEIDENIAETVLSKILADEAPHDISEALTAAMEELDEA